MSTKLTVVIALAGTLLATCLVLGSAQATSVPVPKGDATPGMVTLVGHAGGGHGGHGGGHGGVHGGNFAAVSRGYGGLNVSHGGHGGRNYAYSGARHYAYSGARHYAYSGARHYAYSGDRHGHGYYAGKHYPYGRYASHHRHYRYYGYYGWYPYYSYGYYGGGCGWLYRRAVATGSPYWWNRYYECVGYY